MASDRATNKQVGIRVYCVFKKMRGKDLEAVENIAAMATPLRRHCCTASEEGAAVPVATMLSFFFSVFSFFFPSVFLCRKGYFFSPPFAQLEHAPLAKPRRIHRSALSLFISLNLKIHEIPRTKKLF